MELKDKEQLKTEILQTWLRSAWVYPVQGPEGKTVLRLTPGGRLKMRRRIGELEGALGMKGDDVARQEEAGTLPVERVITSSVELDDAPGAFARLASGAADEIKVLVDQ